MWGLETSLLWRIRASDRQLALFLYLLLWREGKDIRLERARITSPAPETGF